MNPAWISAIAAVIYAGFTFWLILEMRKDRKLLYRPILKCSLIGASFPNTLQFCIKNVGGPAIITDVKCLSEKGTKWNLKSDILPLGRKEVANLTFSLEGRSASGELINLIINYKNVFENEFQEKVMFKVKEDIIEKVPSPNFTLSGLP